MKNFFSQPKLVTAVSIVFAVVIGFFSYKAINKVPTTTVPAAVAVSPASVSPNQDLTLAFATGGKIATVAVKVGDKVHTGQVLATLDAESALGAVNQAKSAYAAAQTNLANVQAQQTTLVGNAYRTLLSDNLQAVPNDLDTSAPAPIITGNYNSQEEGDYIIHLYPSGTNSGESFDISGLETGFTTQVTPNTSVPLGTRGLYIKFANSVLYGSTTWTVSIPNTRATTYTADKNAYDAAVTAQNTAIASAQAQIQNALGALQIAQGNYNNEIITAPANGTIESVSITPGQLASVNTPAIELLTATQ